MKESSNSLFQNNYLVKFALLSAFCLTVTSCANIKEEYIPKGADLDTLAVLRGSDASITKLKFDPEPNGKPGRTFWVSVHRVYDFEGTQVVKQNPWSGSYELLYLPIGKYIIEGSCWSGELSTGYQLAVNLEDTMVYQLHCNVEHLQRASIMRNTYEGKVNMSVEKQPRPEVQ
ncbi:hypothetical protein NBRC116494_37770 [Aurantivibrio plasticivorans]